MTETYFLNASENFREQFAESDGLEKTMKTHLEVLDYGR